MDRGGLFYFIAKGANVLTTSCNHGMEGGRAPHGTTFGGRGTNGREVNLAKFYKQHLVRHPLRRAPLLKTPGRPALSTPALTR